MKNDFYRELPKGYRADKTIDAKSVKFGVLMNVAALVIMVAIYLLTEFISCGRITLIDFLEQQPDGEISEYLRNTLLPLVIFLVAMFAYIVLHELTHGAAYKLLTGEKLTFGITWSAAYCGVPNLYIGKKIALIALLSPFVAFGVIFIVAIAISGATTTGLVFKLLFAFHFGGCAGDLYDALLLIFKYRNGCLMNDDGPKQVFYVYDEKNDAPATPV